MEKFNAKKYRLTIWRHQRWRSGKRLGKMASFWQIDFGGDEGTRGVDLRELGIHDAAFAFCIMPGYRLTPLTVCTACDECP